MKESATTVSNYEQSINSSQAKFDGFNLNSESSQVKFTGSSPLNSVLPWTFDTPQAIS